MLSFTLVDRMKEIIEKDLFQCGNSPSIYAPLLYPNKETTVDETLFGDTIRVVSSPIFKRGFIHVYLLRLETSSYRQNWRKNRMLTIKQVDRKNKNELGTMMAIWESAVKATHTFLTKNDIEALKPEVKGVSAD